MLCTFIGMLLKLIGILLAIPNTWRQYKNWKTKEAANLWVLQSQYRRRDMKIPIKKWKKIVYKITRMPNRHLWE